MNRAVIGFLFICAGIALAQGRDLAALVCVVGSIPFAILQLAPPGWLGRTWRDAAHRDSRIDIP